jgi:hypothetical protein
MKKILITLFLLCSCSTGYYFNQDYKNSKIQEYKIGIILPSVDSIMIEKMEGYSNYTILSAFKKDKEISDETLRNQYLKIITHKMPLIIQQYTYLSENIILKSFDNNRYPGRVINNIRVPDDGYKFNTESAKIHIIISIQSIRLKETEVQVYTGTVLVLKHIWTYLIWDNRTGKCIGSGNAEVSGTPRDQDDLEPKSEAVIQQLLRQCPYLYKEPVTSY